MKKTAKNLEHSFSFSTTKHFQWKKKLNDEEQISNVENSNPTITNSPLQRSVSTGSIKPPPRKKLSSIALSKLRAVLALTKAQSHFKTGQGPKLVGTIFGPKHGHVYFALQDDFKQSPLFLVQLATPTSGLVKEMGSGLVRIALECDKKLKGFKILEEPIWGTYCNGKKCGYAMRRECGPDEWAVLNAIGPISMGAGVLPGVGVEREIMYMRAKFERVIGSKDSEAFYVMNPDGNGGPELSIYLLRV